MVGKSQAAIISAFAVLALLAPSFAQAQSEQKDSLVRLIQASSLELIERDGVNFRKAIDATFLHNGTYLICDTALWDVSSELIDCRGDVQLIQDQTVLTSDRLLYIIPEDLAQFRGSLVQLRNNEDDILRTRFLDYNTRDSMALFERGAAMRDKNGQIIESDRGSYESVAKRFTFEGDVDMFTDSIFVKTEKLIYDSEPNVVDFVSDIDFWKDGYMLSGRRGWYRRNEETFFFHEDVHAQSEEQEAWSDSLYYYRTPNDLEMHGHAQLQDTTRNVFGLADYIYYSDSLSEVTMRRNAAIAVRTVQEEKADTLYCGANEFIYHTKKKCDIPDDIVAGAVARLAEIMADPVSEYRRKAAAEAEKAAAEEAEKERKARGLKNTQAPGSTTPEDEEDEEEPEQTEKAVEDSLSVPADTIPPVPDTSRIGFLLGNGDVKMFRKDIQLRCDSLRYNDLDSIVRCYKEPFVWNEGNRQYTSDSLFILVNHKGADRASLMSNALIITHEADSYYDQIKGTDVMAYFDSTAALRRFDALGGTTALFYLQENEEYSTANMVECKMMSATMKDGSLEKVYYFDKPKNNAYPIAQLPASDTKMKGFNWKPENKPAGKEDITTLTVRPTERNFYDSKPRTSFEHTDVYFPGYMEGVYKSIEEARERARLAQIRRDSLERAERAAADSLAKLVPVDSLAAAPDSVAAPSDSLAAPLDTLSKSAVMDSVSVAPVKELSEREKARIERREAAELAKSMRIARRDARWAELDARDAAKVAKKEEKKQARKQARADMVRRREEKQAARDEARLQKYVDKFEKQKISDERKQQKLESSGKRTQGAQTGGELSAPLELEQ